MSERNAFSDALRILAVVNAIASLIFGLMLFSDFFRGAHPLATIILAIVGLSGIALVTIGFLILADIADNSAAAAYNTNALLRTQEKLQEAIEGETFAAPARQISASNRNSVEVDNGWKCLKCGDTNNVTQTYCHGCGAYK